ncbi:MAG TPA: hypothetical protein VE861_16870, partial [Gemmatimonadaceae bacterium]|nr:hypothetical protein [Gemmatimonadaceae bacterium]
MMPITPLFQRVFAATVLAVTLGSPAHPLRAQSPEASLARPSIQRPWSNSIAVMSGLSQPILFQGTNL